MNLYNNTASGDPLNPIFVSGFFDPNKAASYAVQYNCGVAPGGPPPDFSADPVNGLSVGDAPMNINSNAYLVMFYFPGEDEPEGPATLLSITYVNADLPALAINSWGAQLLLAATAN